MTETEHLSSRAVLRLSGEDRYTFLQGLITQDIEKLLSQPAIFGALLTPQGKILFDFFICTQGDDLLIDCDAESADALLKRLSLYKLRAKVTIEKAEDLNVYASAHQPEGNNETGFADPRHSNLGWRLIGAHTETTTSQAYHERRIAAGIPELGSDFGAEEMFLLDVNYDVFNGVDYKKGCFVGQEVTSRMKRKGDARKRTLVATFEDGPAEKDVGITAGESVLGHLMSSTQNKALALIRLDRWATAKANNIDIVCNGKTLHLALPASLEKV